MSWWSLDARTARITWTILVLLGGLGVVYAMRRAIVVVALSLFFAYLLLPLVRLTQRWLIPTRALAIAVVYAVVLAALGGTAVAIGPRLAIEAQGLAEKLPGVSRDIQSGAIVGDVLRPQGWERREIVEIERFVRAHMVDIVAWARHTGAELLKSLAGAWMIVLIPVFAFFILKDVEQLTATAISRLSPRLHHGMWWQIAGDLHRLLGDYVRAQLLLSLLTFAAWSAIFLMAGVPYALVLAAIGGALEFIPVIGPLIAGLAAIGVSVFGGYSHPWLVVAFVIVWRGIQDYVAAPLILKRGVDMHPALVIVGVLAGGEIGGVVGMFLSVPVIAAVRIVWRRLQEPVSAPVDALEVVSSVDEPFGGSISDQPAAAAAGNRA